MRRDTLAYLLLLCALFVIVSGCRGRRASTSDDREGDDDSGYGDDEVVATGPNDTEAVEQAASDLHVKVKTAMEGGTLDLPEGKAATVELTYSKDEIEVSFENYAAYLGSQVLEHMVRYPDAPYTVVAGSEEREELLKAQADRLNDAYNEDALTEMGDMLAGNLALFVVVRASTDGEGELLSVKLFITHTGAMLYANEYTFASGYQANLELAEEAELAGDTDAAIQYYEAASTARRGFDPRVAQRIAALQRVNSGNTQPIQEYGRKLADLDDDYETLKEEWEIRRSTANVLQLRGIHDRLVALKDRVLALIRFKRVQAAVDVLKLIEEAIGSCEREIRRRS